MESFYIHFTTIVLISAILINPYLVESSTSTEVPTTLAETTPTTSKVESVTSSTKAAASAIESQTSPPVNVTTQTSTSSSIIQNESTSTTISSNISNSSVKSSISTTEQTSATEPTVSSTPSSTHTTFQPSTNTPTPVEYGGNCSISEECKAHDENTACENGTCQCSPETVDFHSINETCTKIDTFKPSNLTLESGKTSINVAWSQPKQPPSGYSLSYVVEIKGGNYRQENTTAKNTTEFTGLKTGTLYNISVKGFLNEFSSVISEAIEGAIWTKPGIPSCPPYRNNYNYKAPNITVSWNGTAERYTVKFDGVSVNVSGNNATFYNLAPGRNYSITLQAHAGDYSTSESDCIVRTESTEPGAPQNVTLDSDIVGQTSLNISIEPTKQPNGDIVAYRIEIYGKSYEDEPNFKPKDPKYLSVTMDNMYTITGLQPGTFYYLLVYTVNDLYNSTSSFNLTGLRAATGAPKAISNFMKSDITNNSFTISFERPLEPGGDVIGYSIYVNQTTNGSFCRSYLLQNTSVDHIQNCQINQSSNIDRNKKMMIQTVGNLIPYTYYNVYIVAWTKDNQDVKLQGEVFKETVKTNISAPKKPEVYPIVDRTDSTVRVSWKPTLHLTGPTKFTVKAYDEISEKNEPEGCSVDPDSSVSYCTVKNLKAYWKYSFRVEANVNGWPAVTSDNSVEVITKQSFPGKVTALKHSLENSGCQLTIYWSTPKLEDRHGVIDVYNIISSSGNRQQFPDSNPEPYAETNKKFVHSFNIPEKQRVQIEIRAMNNNSQLGLTDVVHINTQECFEPLSAGEIVLIIFIVLLVLAVLGAVGYFGVYRNWTEIKQKFSLSQEEEVTLLTPMKPIQKHSRIRNCKYLNFGGDDDEEFETLQPEIERHRPIVLSTISEFLQRYHADDNRLFMAEYEDLKSASPKYSCSAAHLDENKPKNRYTNILPYDHSRVVLSPPDDEEEESTDYINANYIPGYTYGKEYIASQGPLPGTANDFWRMVWEQSVSIIVMLTKCSENNMDKCEHYWPHQADEPKCYDDLMVNVTSISNMGKYDIHVMDLCLGDEKRVVKHFHFLEWPDFSAKVETTTLIDFISTVRSHINPDTTKGPIITHCSAGVGRTGTYITVDYMMQFVRDHDLTNQVDIFDWVLQMREHRTTMVQTYTQYAFIHDCLAEIVERKRKSMQRESEVVNGDVCIDNIAFEPDDLYENTKPGQTSTSALTEL